MNESRTRSWIAHFFWAKPSNQGISVGENREKSDAINNRGVLYASGQGVPLDYGHAAECFRQAAEAGYALAQNNLGLMFAAGHGVLRSESEAGRWFRRAAEQGDPGGQFNLGNLCHPASLGKLVTDAREARIQAHMWFSLAAAQGYSKAAGSCETLNLQMTQAELKESTHRVAEFQPRSESGSLPVAGE